MKLPFFHIMTHSKYSQLLEKLEKQQASFNSLQDSYKGLRMWYGRNLTVLETLREYHSKEKERKIAYIHNFCYGKD